MGRDVMGINHREEGRAPVLYRRQRPRSRTRDKGGVGMARLATTGVQGWCGVAFLWGHSILSLSTFWGFLKKTHRNSILQGEHNPLHPHPTRTSYNSTKIQGRAFKSYLFCCFVLFCSVSLLYLPPTPTDPQPLPKLTPNAFMSFFPQ